MRTWDRLTASFVKGVAKPGKFYDGGGLLLTAAPAGKRGVTKSWVFRFQIDRRERSMGLGSARVVSLAEARAKANEYRKQLAAGIDPLTHRDAQRLAARAAELHTATFKECLDGFLTSHGDRWRTKHLKQWQNSTATYCKPLMGVAVADIDTAMVEIRVIEPEWKRAPTTMDRVRSRIGEVLGWAQARGLRHAGPLPTRWKDHLDKLLPHPRALKPVEHHAAMGFDAVPGLYRKLVATDSIPEQCLAFTILTAVRSQESRGAKWSEIDLKAGVWEVPGERMKRRKPHRVPLSKEALALIGRLPRNGEHLFAINGKNPVVAFSLRNALARHGGPGFTVHGFRSAFRDWGGERTSAPRELLEVALAHAIGNATEASYARTDLLEKRRRVMARWGEHCATPPAPADRDTVVAIRGRRHG